ncbi:MAG: tetratricopeptide repeat protein [Patescibacteria group bacterium]
MVEKIPAKKIFSLISAIGFLGSIFAFALFYLPFTTDPINFPKEIFLYIALAAIAVPALLGLFFFPEIRYKRSIFDWPIIAVCLYFAVNTILSQDIAISFFGRPDVFVLHTSIILGWSLWYAAAIQINNTRKIWRLSMDLILLSGILLALNFFIAYYWPALGIPINPTTRNNSLLGVYLSLILVLNLGFMLSGARLSRVLYYLGGAILQIAVLIQLGFSLPWIVASIGLLLILWLFLFKIPKSADWKFITVIIVLIMAVVTAIFGVFSLLKRPLPVEISLGNGASWRIVTDTMIRNGKNLVIGTGAGTFPYDFARARGREFNLITIVQDVYFNSPYNTIYNIMAELGVLGLLIFLSFLSFGIGFVVILVRETGSWKEFVRGGYRLFEAIADIGKSRKLRPAITEFREASKDDDRFYWEVMVVSSAWITLTLAMFICFFEVSLWWLWWFLLSTLAAGINILGLDINIRKKVFSYNIQPPYSTAIYFAIIVSLCLLAVGFGYGLNVYRGETAYTKSIASNDLEKKQSLLKTAINGRDGYAPYHLALSQVYMLRAADSANADGGDGELSGYLGSAIAEAKLASNLEPANYKNWKNMATIYLNAAPIVDGATKWAIESFARTVSLSPSDYTAYSQLANAYILEGNIEEAEKNYLAAIQLKPDHLPSYALLSDLYSRSGRYDEAINIYEPIINIVSNDPDSAFRLGMLFYNRAGDGDYERARLLFARAVELRPDFSNAIFGLGMAYEKMEDYENALKYYQKVSILNPENKDLKSKIRNLSGKR